MKGRKIPLRRDAIGLMVLEPRCDGPCDIRLDYAATSEAWICRILSVLVTLGMIGFLLRGGLLPWGLTAYQRSAKMNL